MKDLQHARFDQDPEDLATPHEVDDQLLAQEFFSISLLSSEITLVTHTTDARFGGSNYHLPTHSTRPRPFGVPLNCPDDVVVKTPVERQTTRKSYLKLHPTRTTTYQQISLFVRLSLLSSRLSIF